MEVSLCEFKADQFPRGEERRETKTSVLVGREVGEEYNYYEVRRNMLGLSCQVEASLNLVKAVVL